MKPRVLVVEDQDIVMDQICDFLEWIGCEVVGRAKNGIEAVTMFDELKPDLVTMDLIMPEMDGAEATSRIRKADPDARVLVFTSLDVTYSKAENSLVERALVNGATSAVCKFSKTGIANELQKAFGNALDL